MTEVHMHAAYLILFALSRKIVWSSTKFVVLSFKLRSCPWMWKCSVFGDKHSESSAFGSSFCTHAWGWKCIVFRVLGKAYLESPKSESCGSWNGLSGLDSFSWQAWFFGSSWSGTIDAELFSVSSLVSLLKIKSCYSLKKWQNLMERWNC